MAIGKDGAVLRQLRTLFNVGTIRELTDGQLLERFATDQGEAAELAFAVLVERHGPMVLRVCRGVLADPHDTQDAFQATFLVLVQKARSLWVRDSLGPWLHQVAYRTASCARSAAARRRRHERAAARLTQESRTEGDHEREGVLHQEIDRLPERYRAPVVLCDLEGYTHAQAAQHLGWPVGTVKSRLSRARDRLRDRLLHRGLAPNAGLLATTMGLDGPGFLLPPALRDSTTKAAVESVAVRTILRGSAASLAQEVLRSMAITGWWKVASVLLIAAATASGVDLLAQRGGPGVEPRAGGNAQVQAARAGDVAVYEVQPGKFQGAVVERGSLEAAKTQDLYCPVEGQTTIITIVPEGTRVKKGQVVCELDSAALRDQLVNQRITYDSARAHYQNAQLDREVAEIAVTEYVEGIFPSELAEVAGDLQLAQAELSLAEDELRAARARADGAEKRLAVKRAEVGKLRARIALEKVQARRRLLVDYTKGKMIKELRSEVEKARSDELGKQARWVLERTKEENLERQISACTLKAPIDGNVVYGSRVEEGATVRRRQRILWFFDPGGPMVMNAKVHESQVDKIEPKMKARIRVDAFADPVLNGTVIEVAPRPDTMKNASGSAVKVYSTKIRIDGPFPGLRPGMTAQAEIGVDDRDDVLSVPLQAVVFFHGKHHVAVKKPDDQIEWRPVTLGISNEEFVRVKQGIQAGEHVALSPRSLMSAEEKRQKLGPPPRRATPPKRRTPGESAAQSKTR